MFDRVRGLAAAQPLLDATGALLGRDVFAAAAADDRFDNVQAQPLLCAASLTHWQGLREVLPTPPVIAGYSIGELAAHAIAGSFDTTTCLALSAQRARLMDAASPRDAGLQAVLGLDRDATQRLCDTHGAFIAIANGHDHFIVGGLRRGNPSIAGPCARTHAAVGRCGSTVCRSAAGRAGACAAAAPAGRRRCPPGA
ncbi:hypothetical protein G6F32_014433 [Rhizopus arrhizus]|nr:hypothetical protein G6F32_014433 [Rhizopus arrhizus]